MYLYLEVHMESLEKVCKVHGNLKFDDIFIQNARTKKGFTLECKICMRERNKKQYEKRRVVEGRKRNNKWEEGERFCKIHGQLTEDQVETTKQWKNKSGLQMRCKLCCMESDLRFNKHANDLPPSKQKDYRYEAEVLKIHNMTAFDYDKMLAAQNNVCAICKNPETRGGRTKGTVTRMGVDHCHTTGDVRGLLCHACNSSLGKFKDNIDHLQAAIDYFETS